MLSTGLAEAGDTLRAIMYFQTLNRLIRAPSVAARDEWVAELKERASGSLANRKKPGDKVSCSRM